MNSSDSSDYYTFEPPPRQELEPTLKDRGRWIDGLLEALGPTGALSIFAYGSLIWHTDFPVAERTMARAHGYHRSFCIYSFHYRGTRKKPGLVLGLDRGGSCRGMMLTVDRAHAQEVAHYLWRREMVSHAYTPRALTVDVDGKPRVAHTFVADRAHEQYAGGLSLEEMARLIRQGVGNRGTNPDYLEATVRQLDKLGIADGTLTQLAKMVA